MSASGKKVRAFSQSATQKARQEPRLLSIGAICRKESADFSSIRNQCGSEPAREEAGKSNIDVG
jgi:hypothetical protein